MFKESSGIDGAIYDKVVSHFGGSRNAFTSDNVTSYYQLLPANQYPLGLEIESNRMRGLVLDQAKFDKEKEVVKEERRQRTDDNPIAKAYEEFMPKLFPDNPKSRPIIGYMDEIDGISLPQMQKWYDAYYHPNHATLVIAGGVAVSDAKAWVEKYFAHIPQQAADHQPATKPSLRQRSHRGYQELTTYQKVTVPSLVIAYNVPTLSTATDTDEPYALWLFSSVADGGKSSPFSKNLVRGKELLTSVSIGYSPYEYGDDVLYILATPREGVSLEQAKAAILDELHTLMTTEIADSELKKSQVSLNASLVLQNDSIASQARSLGTLAMLDLPLDSFEKLPTKLQSISKDKIQTTAKKYLSEENMSVMFILPQDDKPQQ